MSQVASCAILCLSSNTAFTIGCMMFHVHLRVHDTFTLARFNIGSALHEGHGDWQIARYSGVLAVTLTDFLRALWSRN
jgi:hypothetical protein